MKHRLPLAPLPVMIKRKELPDAQQNIDLRPAHSFAQDFIADFFANRVPAGPPMRERRGDLLGDLGALLQNAFQRVLAQPAVSFFTQLSVIRPSTFSSEIW